MRKISFTVPVIKRTNTQDSTMFIFLLASLEINPDSLELGIKDMDEELAISLAVYESKEKKLDPEIDREEKNDIELDLLLSHFASMADGIVKNGGYKRFSNISYKADEKPVWLIASSNKEFLDGVEYVTTPFSGKSTEESFITGTELSGNMVQLLDIADTAKLTFFANLAMLCPFYDIETLDISESKYAKIIAYLQNDFSKALDDAMQELYKDKAIDETNITQLSDFFRRKLLKIRDIQNYKDAIVDELGVQDKGNLAPSVFTVQGKH